MVQWVILMKYVIANTIVEIVSEYHLINMSVYSDFIVDLQNESSDIYIEILDILQSPCRISYGDLEHNTYKWMTLNDEKIMIFSKRGIYLDESSREDIWLLMTCGSKNAWQLFIPQLNSITDRCLNAELERRPWLQRLFAVYYMNTDTAILHGALCNIAGSGYLFLGDSGVGKSTICSIINKKFSVYSDDRFILKINAGEISAFGTPWNIKNKQYCINKSININKIYFLSHGDNILEKMKSDFTLLTFLMRQILHSGVYDSKSLLYWKLSFAHKLSKECQSFYKFAFIPDETCLEYIIGN